MNETVKEAPKYKRTTLLVNRKLQFRIMAYMTGVSAMSSLITSLSSYLLSSYAEQLTLSGSISLIFLLSFLLVAGWTAAVLLFSNRIFGPIYRLQREIRNWRDGNPVHQIHLRKGDHMTELIDDFNLLVAKAAPQAQKVSQS